MEDINNRLGIICQVHGTNLERIRKFKRCTGSDLKALKDISSYLRSEQYWSYDDIADLLFRHESTIRHHLNE